MLYKSVQRHVYGLMSVCTMLHRPRPDLACNQYLYYYYCCCCDLCDSQLAAYFTSSQAFVSSDCPDTLLACAEVTSHLHRMALPLHPACKALLLLPLLLVLLHQLLKSVLLRHQLLQHIWPCVAIQLLELHRAATQQQSTLSVRYVTCAHMCSAVHRENTAASTQCHR